MTGIYPTSARVNSSPVMNRTFHPSVTAKYSGVNSICTPGVSYSSPSATQYFSGHGQSIAGGRIYSPPNAEYCPPGTPLKGGMYTIYDSSAVPTFEAPILFSGSNEGETRSFTHNYQHPQSQMQIVGRGQSSHNASSHIRVPKRTSKNKGCCAC